MENLLKLQKALQDSSTIVAVVDESTKSLSIKDKYGEDLFIHHNHTGFIGEHNDVIMMEGEDIEVFIENIKEWYCFNVINLV